jgi:hypothetical protein
LYGARFVHLYRDGRYVVRSGYEYPWYTKRYDPLTILKRLLRRRYLVDIGISNEDHRLIPPKSLKDRFEKISWLWTEINRVIIRDLTSLPDDRSLRIAVETLNDSSGFRRILDFVDVDYNEQTLERMTELARRKPNKVDEHELDPPDEWSEKRNARFNEIAGEMMRRLGYT